MTTDAKYYMQAIERAVGLLRQGHPNQALILLQNALGKNLKSVPDCWDEDTDIELVFDPRTEETPRCWIEDNHLYIDDKNWNIDSQFMEFLFQSIKYNISQKLDIDKIRGEAEKLLKKGVKTGRVRKKKKSCDVVNPQHQLSRK